jgi:LysR family positive regulator for ilvC
MDHRSLRQFVNLAESLHFGRASEASNISPSALSRGIRRLEETVGAELFERNNRRVALTRAGGIFLNYARTAIGEWDAVRNRLMAESGDLNGEVSLYCSVTASYSFLFDILARVRQDHPRIEIKLHTGDPEDAIARVLAGTEDIAIAALPDRLARGLAFRPIEISPLVFIVAANAANTVPAGEASANVERWAACPMILSERGLARTRVDAWFRKLEAQPRIYAQVAGNEAIVSMVSLGFGVGVVPKIVLDNSPLVDTVTTADVRPALAPYEVGLVTLEKKLENPLIRAFWSEHQDLG